MTYGANTIRDGVSLTPRRELRALALPSEIMRLPNLEGYLKFPGPFPVASIRLKYVERPPAAERFVARAGEGAEAPAPDEEAGGTADEDTAQAPQDWSGQGELFGGPPAGGDNEDAAAEAAVMDVPLPGSVRDEGDPDGTEKPESDRGEARPSAGTPAPSGKRKGSAGADSAAPGRPRPSPDWA